MQLTYVFSELGNGLKRNVSMTVAVILTIFISLTLVGMGLLLNAQAQRAEQSWGDRLQITVFLCTDVSASPNCIDGRVTNPQKATVEKAINGSDEVESYHFESGQEAYDKFSKIYEKSDGTQSQVLQSMNASDFPESFWITLKDPKKFQGVKSAVLGLPGVADVRDLRKILNPIYKTINGFKLGALGVAAFLVLAAILQVGNTIRLAAFARRREIGIMRLVGASSWYVQLPFLLEALFAAVVGVALASGAIALFMWLVIEDRLSRSGLVAWVTWGDAFQAIAVIGLVGLGLTVLPTLLLTRKYLRV